MRSTSFFFDSSHRSRLAGPHVGPNLSLAKVERDSKSRPPSYASKLLGSPYLIVGYPCTPTDWHKDSPPAVQSTSPTKMLGWSSYSAINLSQSGFIDLQ